MQLTLEGASGLLLLGEAGLLPLVSGRVGSVGNKLGLNVLKMNTPWACCMGWSSIEFTWGWFYKWSSKWKIKG